MSYDQIRSGTTAGLSSEWKDPGLMLWVRLGADPKDPDSATRRPWTAPTASKLPEDKAHSEIKGSGKSTDSFKWTNALEQSHSLGLQRIQRHLDTAADRRRTVMEQRAEAARVSCNQVAAKTSALFELENEIANGGKKGGGGGGHGGGMSVTISAPHPFSPVATAGHHHSESFNGESTSSPFAPGSTGGGGSFVASKGGGSKPGTPSSRPGTPGLWGAATSGGGGAGGGGGLKAAHAASSSSSLDSTAVKLLAYNRATFDPSRVQAARLSRLNNLPRHAKGAMWAAHERSEAAAALKLRKEARAKELADAAKANPALLLGGGSAAKSGKSGRSNSAAATTTTSTGQGGGASLRGSIIKEAAVAQTGHLKLNSAMEKLKVVGIFGSGSGGRHGTGGGSGGGCGSGVSTISSRVPKLFATSLPSGDPLPAGVMPWAVETEGRTHRPTKAHANFIASNTRARAIGAANALIATPALGHSNALLRESLSRDVAEYVHALVDIDKSVLHGPQVLRQGTENALLFHSLISEATSCPYSALGGLSKDEQRRLEQQKKEWKSGKKTGLRTKRFGGGGEDGGSVGSGEQQSENNPTGKDDESSGGGSVRSGGTGASSPVQPHSKTPPARRANIFSSKATAAAGGLGRQGAGEEVSKAAAHNGFSSSSSSSALSKTISFSPTSTQSLGRAPFLTKGFSKSSSSMRDGLSLTQSGRLTTAGSRGAVGAAQKKGRPQEKREPSSPTEVLPPVFRREAFGRCIPSPQQLEQKKRSLSSSVGGASFVSLASAEVTTMGESGCVDGGSTVLESRSLPTKTANRILSSK